MGLSREGQRKKACYENHLRLCLRLPRRLQAVVDMQAPAACYMVHSDRILVGNVVNYSQNVAPGTGPKFGCMPCERRSI